MERKKTTISLEADLLSATSRPLGARSEAIVAA